MNRRGFLKLLGVSAATAALPVSALQLAAGVEVTDVVTGRIPVEIDDVLYCTVKLGDVDMFQLTGDYLTYLTDDVVDQINLRNYSDLQKLALVEGLEDSCNELFRLGRKPLQYRLVTSKYKGRSSGHGAYLYDHPNYLASFLTIILGCKPTKLPKDCTRVVI